MSNILKNSDMQMTNTATIASAPSFNGECQIYIPPASFKGSRLSKINK